MAKVKNGPVSVGTVASYLLFRQFAAFVGLLPRGWVLAWGRAIGVLACALDAKHRRIALDNLARALGTSMSAKERRTTARRSFANFVQALFDALKTARWDRRRLMTLFDVEGAEHLDRAAAAGRGVLLFTAHYGNWEMVIPPIAERIPFHILARAMDNPLIDRHVVKARTRRGADIINKLGAGRPILRALTRKEAVAILIDLNVLRREAVFVDFFGTPAATTPALAYFHIRTGAPLLPMFCVYAPGGRYRMTFGPPLDIPLSGNETEDVLKITGVCTKMIEETIRRNPEPWFWVHKRWQSRPLNEKP